MLIERLGTAQGIPRARRVKMKGSSNERASRSLLTPNCDWMRGVGWDLMIESGDYLVKYEE